MAFLSLTAEDVGKSQSFLDINAAKQNGLFGEEPIKVWHDDQWRALLEMVVSGMQLVDTDWEALKYCPKTWSDAETKRKGAPPMHKANLGTLKDLAFRPDPYLTHLKNQPAFEASDVASVTSTASSFRSKTDVALMDAFEEATKELWNTETKAALPKIAAEAKAAKPNGKALGSKK